MTDQTRRFTNEQDTPCPFRLARFGYARTGAFRVPTVGEFYIQPTEGPELQEHEPVILGDSELHATTEPRHIVRPISGPTQEAVAQFGPFAAMFLTDDQVAELLPEAA